MDKTKPYEISKLVVVEAFQRVKANKGAAGIDDQSLEAFEADLKNNLYKIWNRMSSGSYFPPPVRAVEIPKKTGGVRVLGVPTVADRVAQMVVKIYFEPKVEPHFHQDSYGYRPGKSAADALAVTRQRCWRYDWVLDFDITLEIMSRPRAVYAERCTYRSEASIRKPAAVMRQGAGSLAYSLRR